MDPRTANQSGNEEPAPQPLSNPPPTHDLFQPFDTLAYLYDELDAFAATAGFAVYRIHRRRG